MASRRNVEIGLLEAARAYRRERSHRLGHALCGQHRDSRPPACSWWKKRATRALGRSRGGFGTKIHLRTDGRGNPLAFKITGGEEHDAPHLLRLMDMAKIKRVGRGRPRQHPVYLAGDKGYDSRQIREALRARGITPIIPARSNRKRKITIDVERYRGRNVIERCF